MSRSAASGDHLDGARELDEAIQATQVPWTGADLDADVHEGAGLSLVGTDPVLNSPLRLGLGAATAIGLGARTAATVARARGNPPQHVTVRVPDAAASLVGFGLLRVEGRESERENAANPTVALYRGADGRWIHLHGGFPHLAAGTLEVLDVASPDRDAIASAVARWRAEDLEAALASRGLCGAVVRTAQEWALHPHGRALTPLGVITLTRTGDAAPWRPKGAARALAGVRVLDCTRVLAGPTAGRTLASYGADVLRLNGPDLPDLRLFQIETGHGKRSANLDLNDADNRHLLDDLVAGTDVFIDGFRPGALARHRLDPASLTTRRPGIVTVSISCYGPGGPFESRPGWEQLAQATTGMAVIEGDDGAAPPRVTPAAATDYTTGYLAAWGVLEALRRRLTEGGSWHVQASLCQTAMWFVRLGVVGDRPGEGARPVGFGDLTMVETDSDWGILAHQAPVPDLPATPAGWDRPSCPPGTHPPAW